MNRSPWHQYLTRQQLQCNTNDKSSIEKVNTTLATCIAPLLYKGVLSVNGADSKKFLQGQLTCDVNNTSPQQASHGAACSPQGKIFSNFKLLQKSSETEIGFLLSMPNDLINSMLETIHKYSVFFKVKLKNASDEWLGLGIWGELSEELINKAFVLAQVPQHVGETATNETTIVTRVPGDTPRFECWIKATQIPSIWQVLITQANLVSYYDWILKNIQQGLGEIYSATQNTFNPHMINLQTIGAISFDKGCYTGQEIIARTHYRGKSKRHMQRFSLHGGELLTPGTELLDLNNNNSIATVIDAAPIQTLTIEKKTQEALLVINANIDTDSPLELSAGEQIYLTKTLSLPYIL